MCLKLSGLLVLRGMEDHEQQGHVGRLKNLAGDTLLVVEESEVRPEDLAIMLSRQLASTPQACPTVRLDGAETAAHHIMRGIARNGRLKCQS